MDTNQLLQALKPQELTNYSKKSELTPEEDKIIQLKYQSKQFAKMAPEELINQAAILLVKIHVITGWEIPQKEFLNILVDQFTKKISESYGGLNADEIEYIFRNKPTDIKEWGKAMNISLFDEVIFPYLEKRFELSRFEEQKSQKQIEYKPDFEKIDKEFEDFLKTDLGKKFFQNGK